MTFKEQNLAVFQRRPIEGVLFQPRIHYWYEHNRDHGTLPERYRGASLWDVFDDLNVSVRYFPETTGLWPITLVCEPGSGITETEIIPGREVVKTVRAPGGTLTARAARSSDGTWHSTEHFIKTPEDLDIAASFFGSLQHDIVPEAFASGIAQVGDRGEPQFFLPRSPYQQLAIDWMGLENLIYALADCPERVERLFKAIDDSFDLLYRRIIELGSVRIVNFGENIDSQICPPRYFEEYCLPFWHKRAGQLRQAGIFTHIHIDGSFKPLLRFLKDLPFDGLEALTPSPQGDVPLEEIKEHSAGKILLDVLPAIMFLPTTPQEELDAFVEKTLALFAPNIILGVSDELPPPADIERVRRIAARCRNRA